MSEHPKAVVTIDGTEYTLQFTRDSIRMLEGMGMAPTTDERAGTPLVMITSMFYAALRLYHKNMNQTQSEHLFDELLDAGISFEDISTVLMELYNAVFNPPVLEGGEPKATLQKFGMAETKKEKKTSK